MELELKAENESAKIGLKDPAQYQSVTYSTLEAIVASGASVFLSRLGILRQKGVLRDHNRLVCVHMLRAISHVHVFAHSLFCLSQTSTPVFTWRSRRCPSRTTSTTRA